MNTKNNISCKLLWVAAAFSVMGCTREIDTDVLATYPTLSEVFIDGFASDLNFQAWGKTTNFNVDSDTKYDGTSSMRIEVPLPSDPLGSWAGGVFYSSMGRDLSGYDALTFYAKSSVSTEVEVGIGNYADEDYLVQVSDVSLNTNWSQVIIPLPNPAKLLSEQGLFYYSAGAVDDDGYSIWIDEVKFEKLGTLAHPAIEDAVVPGFAGGTVEIGDLTETINLPNGVNRTMVVSSGFFTYESSNADVATVANGVISVHKPGEAVLTLKEAAGEITVKSYDFAPTPANREAADVLSLFCDAYEDAVSVTWNPGWNYSTAEYSEVGTDDDRIGYYTGLNFVGIVFGETLDCSEMEYLHLDLLCMDEVSSTTEIGISIYYGTDEVITSVNLENYPAFKSGEWLSLDLPLTGANKQIPQLALSCDDNTRNILLDNVYFYKN